VLLNPLTRPLAAQIAHSDWRATHKQINFPYTLEDAVIGGENCVRYRTSRTDPANPVILYLHAGAFVCGSPRINATGVLPACELSGCEAIGVDYALAPNATYPTQLDQIERVYRALLDQGRSPSRILLMGDSAGGTLALASMNRWRRAGLPAPAGIVTLSAMTDATGASDTHLTLAQHDPVFGSHAAEGVHTVTRLYAPGVDAGNPEISPVYDDYRGAPPMLIHVGSRDVLLGDSARLAERARRAGVDVTLRVFDGMFHLFHMHWALEDARASFEDIADFIARVAAQERRACTAA